MNWLIELPSETKISIGVIVLTVFSLLISYVSSVYPWLGEFLKKYKEEWALGVTALIVQLLQANLPGGDWSQVSILSVQLVAAIALVLLSKWALKKMKVRGFRG